MTDNRLDGFLDPSDPNDEFVEEWAEFARQLKAYVAMMTDPADEDRLRVEVGGAAVGEEFPKLEISTVGKGWGVVADLEEDVYLEPMADVPELVDSLVSDIHDGYGITHPQLLTYQAWGPAAPGAGSLGLSPTEGGDPADTQVLTLSSTQDVHAAIGRVLQAKYGEEEVHVDGDGDWFIRHMAQPVFIRSLAELPAVQIFARVAHGVHSRRGTATELAVLNRSSLWVTWQLRDRDVFQTITIPARILVPQHLDQMLDVFCFVMSWSRDDLALRTGGQVA